MPIINSNAKEIHSKIVYWGPEGSGKSSSLDFIESHSSKQKITSFSLDLDPPLKTLVLSLGQVVGFDTFFHIHACRTAFLEEASVLMRGCDGIVFVANSELTAEKQNRESLNLLNDVMKKERKSLFKVPIILQYNKRDLTEKLPIEYLRSQLNKYNSRDFESSVAKGQCILEPLKYTCKSILTILKTGERP